MKNFLTILLLCIAKFCLAGTGGANDFGLFLFSIIAIIIIIIAIWYFIIFIIRKIKNSKSDSTIATFEDKTIDHDDFENLE